MLVRYAYAKDRDRRVSLDVTARELAEADLHRQCQELARVSRRLEGREARASELMKEIDRLKGQVGKKKSG